jgi:hypothetical protein
LFIFTSFYFYLLRIFVYFQLKISIFLSTIFDWFFFLFACLFKITFKHFWSEVCFFLVWIWCGSALQLIFKEKKNYDFVLIKVKRKVASYLLTHSINLSWPSLGRGECQEPALSYSTEYMIMNRTDILFAIIFMTSPIHNKN